MKEKYLFELERNLELQASGFLMQKDNLLLQSQLRTEHFQIKMLDRIRAMQNNELILDVLDLGNIKGILKEVASDHICLEVGQKEIIIPTWSIQWSKSLIKMSKSATMLQSKWNLQSLLRSVLIEKLDIIVCLRKDNLLNGQITNVYFDHFDMLSEKNIYSIQFSTVKYISKDRDLND
ncbi:MAG: hypothetical protein NWS44_02615 [Candidatus Nanopelagicales bacterium]|nr:hypothetical protein [Candidatus Nanopelagicales bacterium]